MSMLYGSVDLHSNNSYAAISNEKDEVIRHKRLPNRIEELDRFFGDYKDSLSDIVVESTYNGYWLVDGLKERGYGVKLANPTAMVQYSGLKYTDDKSDALWLNRVHRLGVLPTGYIYPREDRPIRDLLRKRLNLVHTRTNFINSVKHQFLTWNAASYSKDELYKLSPEDVKEQFQDEFLRKSVNSLLTLIRAMTTQVKEIELLIKSRTVEHPLIERLKTIYGIGPLLGWTIHYETGEIQRFRTDKHYLSYCGLVPSVKISNQRIKGHGNVKNRNKFLRWAFAEAAIKSMGNPKMRAYHDRLVKKKGIIKAKTIISSKLARVAFKIMSDPDFVYDVNKLFN